MSSCRASSIFLLMLCLQLRETEWGEKGGGGKEEGVRPTCRMRLLPGQVVRLAAARSAAASRSPVARRTSRSRSCMRRCRGDRWRPASRALRAKSRRPSPWACHRGEGEKHTT